MALFKKALLISVIATYASILLSAQASIAYKAAGVLPYAVDSTGGVKILVGVSSVHKNQATDFGGKADLIDNNNPLQTAAREGCEELMFVFDTDAKLKQLADARLVFGKALDISRLNSTSYIFLSQKLIDTVHCFASLCNQYMMHFIKFDYQEKLPKLFLKRKFAFTGRVPHSWDETAQLLWIDLDTVFHAIDNRSASGPVQIGNQCLYEPFVQSLLAARANGIIANILQSL